MANKDYSRRKFINQCLHTGSLCFGSAMFLISCHTNDSPGEKSGNKKQSTSDDPCSDLSGVSSAELEKRQKFGYVKKSADAERFCGNCSLHLPPFSEKDCGGCLLFKGPVSSTGYCIQYVAKV
ncbi:MAG: hypothetical protein ABI472_22695 [Ginsengibacter sp.]